MQTDQALQTKHYRPQALQTDRVSFFSTKRGYSTDSTTYGSNGVSHTWGGRECTDQEIQWARPCLPFPFLRRTTTISFPPETHYTGNFLSSGERRPTKISFPPETHFNFLSSRRKEIEGRSVHTTRQAQFQFSLDKKRFRFAPPAKSAVRIQRSEPASATDAPSREEQRSRPLWISSFSTAMPFAPS